MPIIERARLDEMPRRSGNLAHLALSASFPELLWQRCSEEVGASQPSSAALNTIGVYRFINAKQPKAAEERTVRVPLRYQLPHSRGRSPGHRQDRSVIRTALPCDHILVAPATVEGITLLTADPRVAR